MTEQQERDERAIEKILRIYALAMDARRWDLFDSIFTQDVRANYPSARWTDVQSFKRDFADAHAMFDATQHAVMTPLVEVDGDSAGSFAYVSFRLIRRGMAGGDFLEGQGWYDDHWVRTPHGWRIAERNCRILWSDGNPAATGGRVPMDWHPMRVDAAEGKIGFLERLDRRLTGA